MLPTHTSEIIPILSSFCNAFASLMENLYEYLHGTDEDGRECLDPFQAAHQDLSMHLVSQLMLASVHIPGHLCGEEGVRHLWQY